MFRTSAGLGLYSIGGVRGSFRDYARYRLRPVVALSTKALGATISILISQARVDKSSK